MKNKNKQFSVESLGAAFRALHSIKTLSLQTMYMPFAVMAVVYSGFFYYKPDWYTDIVVDCILGLFFIGQITAFRQILSIRRGTKNALKVVKILEKNGNRPNLDDLKAYLEQYAPFGYVRDILLRWVNLGLIGEVKENRTLLENASQRRDITDQKALGFHVALNRMTLKLGFIGTLWGLLQTFTPMQRAILSLKEFNGEMAFVKDIVQAIKGDEYAIYSTLIATGLSLIIELLVIQILTKLYSGFIISDSCLNDWNSMVLLPAVERRKRQSVLPESFVEMQKGMENRAVQIQESMKRAVDSFLATADSAEKQLQILKELHERFASNVRELREFEQKRYLGQLEDLEHQIGDRIKELREYDRLKKRIKTGPPVKSDLHD